MLKDGHCSIWIVRNQQPRKKWAISEFQNSHLQNKDKGKTLSCENELYFHEIHSLSLKQRLGATRKCPLKPRVRYFFKTGRGGGYFTLFVDCKQSLFFSSDLERGAHGRASFGRRSRKNRGTRVAIPSRAISHARGHFMSRAFRSTGQEKREITGSLISTWMKLSLTPRLAYKGNGFERTV